MVSGMSLTVLVTVMKAPAPERQRKMSGAKSLFDTVFSGFCLKKSAIKMDKKKVQAVRMKLISHTVTPWLIYKSLTSAYRPIYRMQAN